MAPRNSDRQEPARKAYTFLRQHYEEKTSFSVTDLMAATGWSKSSARTYMGKQFRELLDRRKGGEIFVRPEIQRLTEAAFLRLTTQRQQIYTSYKRVKYQEVVIYEFLLPLTREDSLRKALDDLFYTDTIRQRLRELKTNQLITWVAREPAEAEDAYLDRLCSMVSEKFGGYSISHVSGRYRAGALTSRGDAARMLAADERYIIDETTASVRFIIPIKSTKNEDEQGINELNLAETLPSNEVIAEIALVHSLFFQLFVEAVVRMVDEEDEIWLVEEAGRTRSLYVWERA